MKQSRAKLWADWRCRNCGAKASRNIVCLRAGYIATIGYSGPVARRVSFDRTTNKLTFSFIVPIPDAVWRIRRVHDCRPGYYCRRCGAYLARTVPDLFHVFGGLLTLEEAKKLLDNNNENSPHYDTQQVP